MGVDPRPDWFQDEVTAGNITTQLADGEIDDGNPWNHKKTCCMIKTLEGVMRGNYDDYIIRGVKGEIYPCKPDIFEATYEAAEGSEIIIPDKLRRPAEVERDELRKQLADARAEIEEHHERVRMCHKRTVEADKLWQKAHNKPDVWPDLGELIQWLMKRSDERRCCHNCKNGPKPGYQPVCASCCFAMNNPTDGKMKWEERASDEENIRSE